METEFLRKTNFITRIVWRVQDFFRTAKEKFLMWVAWRLPRELVKWCYIRVGAHATTNQFDDTDTTHLTILDALERWDQ